MLKIFPGESTLWKEWTSLNLLLIASCGMTFDLFIWCSFVSQMATQDSNKFDSL